MSSSINITLDQTPAQADPLVREALAAEGFGILTEIDVQATLREKLGEEIGPYTILGACNPSLAHRALGVDPDVGVLLPCNVVLRQNASGGTDVLAADPDAMVQLQGEQLADVAADARARLVAALDRLSQGR